MSTNNKFDITSSSPDRLLYPTGQRGSHLATQLDRSGSFRESMENPGLASLPSMSRSSSAVAQEEVASFFQCLRFDPKVVAAEHKSNRQVDFKRHMNVALGISMVESVTGTSKGKLPPCPIPEEIKRVKAGLRENSIKARERMKIFNEALSVLNKFFPSIPSKKRTRSEGFCNDRSNPSLSSDRSGFGPGIGKMGLQNHSMSNDFEPGHPKSEERIKSCGPNKRTRTSLVDARMDVRSTALVKQSGAADRDREVVRQANSGAVQCDDRTLPISMNWEKSKMKRKRTGKKPDISSNVASSKPVDGYREPKQGVQQRLVIDARSRLSNDLNGLRPGVANGVVGVGKSDTISQQTGSGVRSSLPRADVDNNSFFNDRRDRPTSTDKERVNLRTINKTNTRDEFNSTSPTSSPKLNGSVRGPRSGSGVQPNLSPGVHRTTAPSDWEISSCTNKPLPVAGANNRKRTTSNRSSSPPVGNWAGQRPQKISRIARRTNLVPNVPNNDESSSIDPADVVGNEIGLGFPKRLAGKSPQQVKLKGDTSSSAALSESEESGAAEIKPKDKGKNLDEADEKAGQNVQKVSALVLPSRKNKLAMGEDLGDGVRRQGRSGRGSSSTRPLMPMRVEKPGNVGTSKQLRSTRVGFTKAESKAGRPPTRKLSDRRAYTRQKLAAIDTGVDFLVGSDDGYEELLAAVNAIIKTTQVISKSFWRQMEPAFGFITDVDIGFLKQQGDLESNAMIPKLNPSTVDGCNFVPNGYGLFKHDAEVRLSTEIGCVEPLPEQLLPCGRDDDEVPLYQRILAALITEEDFSDGSEDLQYDGYGTDFTLNPVMEYNGFSHMVNFESARHTAYNGYRITGKLEDDDSETDTFESANKGMNSSHFFEDMFSGYASVPGMTTSESHYDYMQTDEKVYLEAQSIGIFLEPISGSAKTKDRGIGEEFFKLNEMYYKQVSKKKFFVDKLLKCASEMKELQEKEFDQWAYDKLVAMAYEKYMACRGPHTKSSSNKMARLAALACVKRTLKRCHQYEGSGKSCFNEAVFKNTFISGLAPKVDTHTDVEYIKPYSISNHFLETRISASNGSSPMTSWTGQNGDCYSSDLLPSVNCFSGKTIGSDDTWSNMVKKRELLLDDVGGSVDTSQNGPSGIASPLSSSTKGKLSERDRDGNGQNREVTSRNGTTNKIGRPALSNTKGERKSKTKPKTKTTQLSVSVNRLVGRIPEVPQPKPKPSCETTSNSNANKKNELNMDVLDNPLDLSHLQIPEMDELGGPDDLGSQAQDLSTWLNIDEDALQDHDFMGLEIPMDDLSDLNMMV